MQAKWIAQDRDGRICKFMDKPYINATQNYRFVTSNGNCGVLQESLCGKKTKGWKQSLINLETHDYKIEDGILMRVEKTNHKRHKHADLIHAWAEGVEIEYRNANGDWEDANPGWFENREYRIKPAKKTIRFRNYLYKGQVMVAYKDADNTEWIGDWQEVEVNND